MILLLLEVNTSNKYTDGALLILLGGAGGGVLANRLTEEVNFNVLLIEAGSR